MNKDRMTIAGTIKKRLTGNDFSTELENGLIIICSKANKFKISPKRIVEGDKVMVEIPPNQSEIKRGMLVGFQE